MRITGGQVFDLEQGFVSRDVCFDGEKLEQSSAGGKTYENWNQLCHRETETPGVYTDIYGRSVFFDAERFPCFDSDDFLYENRFYRWFFILEKSKITRVFYTDECKVIDITEDVANIEDSCWSKLGRLHFWDTEAGKDQNRA